MSDNQQRAHELAQRVGVYDTDEIRQALDAAEARGRAVVAARIEALAAEWVSIGGLMGGVYAKRLLAAVAAVRGEPGFCHSIGHEDRLATQVGVFDDGERQEPIGYCDECARLLDRQCPRCHPRTEEAS